MWRFIYRLSGSVVLLVLLFLACLFVFENPQNTELVLFGTSYVLPVWVLLFGSVASGFLAGLALTQGKILHLQALLWWRNR